ncbi:DUF3795 domain-containing protein [Myxococcota bacterium]|nr:DUF3795 domain-containing protein [Myxococcota bacterium]MBU1380412.1 DUF3795 domain-containing protein [Myxococcota bacterium]MBU1497238.1 DUF3795 domain-containing protein [Myxococcota bacterium]
MKMPDSIDTGYFAPCGMNCLLCYVHLRKKKSCAGCLMGDENKPERCKKCLIAICAAERNLKYCFECGDFPCKSVKNLDKSYRTRYKASLIENSKMVGEDGVEEFMKTEKNKWICCCGGIVGIHDSICSECGKDFRSKE